MHAVEESFHRLGYRVRVFPDASERFWRSGVTLVPREGNLVRGKSVKDMARRPLGFVTSLAGPMISRRFASGGRYTPPFRLVMGRSPWTALSVSGGRWR